MHLIASKSHSVLHSRSFFFGFSEGKLFKVPWVKVDFNKWKDEDDEEDDLDGGPGGFDFSKYMADAGAGGGGGAPNLDDFDDEDEDTEGCQ